MRNIWHREKLILSIYIPLAILFLGKDIITGRNLKANDTSQYEITSDTEPPQLIEFDFNPKEIDTTDGPVTITFTMRITDDLSGVNDQSDRAYFKSTISSQTKAGFLYDDADRVSGDKNDGIYVDTIVLPQYSAPGIWKLDDIVLRDEVYNSCLINYDDFVNMGFPVEFTNVGIGDIEPLQLVEFDFNPKVIDTTYGPATITFTMRITDDLSGVNSQSDRAFFESSLSGQKVSALLYDDADRISGDKNDGIYVDTIVLPQYSAPGIWKIEDIVLRDEVYNARLLDYDDFINMGFPVEFINNHYFSFIPLIGK